MDNLILAAGLLGCCTAGFTGAYILLARRVKKLEKDLYVRIRKNTELETELTQKTKELTQLHKVVNDRNKANVVALEQIQNAIRDVDEQKFLLEDTRAKLFASFKTLTQDSIPSSNVLEGKGKTAQIPPVSPGKQAPIVVNAEKRTTPDVGAKKSDNTKSSDAAKKPETTSAVDNKSASDVKPKPAADMKPSPDVKTAPDEKKDAPPKTLADQKEKSECKPGNPADKQKQTAKPESQKNDAATDAVKSQPEKTEDKPKSEPSSLLKRKK